MLFGQDNKVLLACVCVSSHNVWHCDVCLLKSATFIIGNLYELMKKLKRVVRPVTKNKFLEL